MKRIINQIYWDQINAGYMTGTSFKKDANEEISFENELMPAGKIIMKWSSSLNYQANKEVPRLPILLNGKKYRLMATLDVEPENTAIFCLRFFDLQTNEIQKIIFSEKEKEFVYPANAVSYSLEIINGGCKKIEFNRIQLGDAALPIESFSDFYPVTLNSTDKNQKNCLLIVTDSKRARELDNISQFRALNFNLVIGYLSWQNSKVQLEQLAQFLSNYSAHELSLLSTNENSDQYLHKIKSELNFQNNIIFSKDLMENQTGYLQNSWFDSQINSVNIQDAINSTIAYFRE